MVELSTGFVLAGAYADKVRRTLFAQLRNQVKSGEVDSKEVARASAELNRILYIMLVENLGVEKGDVVRIRIEYSVENGKIKWHLDTLRVEYFKRVEIEDEKIRELIDKALETVTTEAPPPVEEKGPEFLEAVSEAILIGETEAGEYLFAIRDKNGDNIGIASLTSMDEKSKVDIIIVPAKGTAYRSVMSINKPIAVLIDKPTVIIEEMKQERTWMPLEADEARRIIEDKMRSLR